MRISEHLRQAAKNPPLLTVSKKDKAGLEAKLTKAKIKFKILSKSPVAGTVVFTFDSPADKSKATKLSQASAPAREAATLEDFLRQAAKMTYRQAHDAILKALQTQGWKTNTTLKVPWAAAPSNVGNCKLFFKTQAIYVAARSGPGSLSLKDGHTIGYDTNFIKRLATMQPKQIENYLIEMCKSELELQQKFGN